MRVSIGFSISFGILAFLLGSQVRVLGQTLPDRSPVGALSVRSGYQAYAVHGLYKVNRSNVDNFGFEGSLFATPRSSFYVGFSTGTNKDVDRAEYYKGDFGIRYFVGKVNSPRTINDDFGVVYYDPGVRFYGQSFFSLGRFFLSRFGGEYAEIGSEYFGVGVGIGVQLPIERLWLLIIELQYEGIQATTYSPIDMKGFRSSAELGVAYLF